MIYAAIKKDFATALNLVEERKQRVIALFNDFKGAVEHELQPEPGTIEYRHHSQSPPTELSRLPRTIECRDGGFFSHLYLQVNGPGDTDGTRRTFFAVIEVGFVLGANGSMILIGKKAFPMRLPGPDKFKGGLAHLGDLIDNGFDAGRFDAELWNVGEKDHVFVQRIDV
jgi:hypothetical protein